MDISVLIVSYNTDFLIRPNVDALMPSLAGLKSEVIYVDNNSTDGSVENISDASFGAKLIVSPVNVGFGRANNLAVRASSGRYVLLLNTDAFVDKTTISETIAYMDLNTKCGILGVRLVGRDDVLQPCARYFPTPWNLFLQRAGLARIFPAVQMVDDMDWDHASVRRCDWVVGCYYLIRREVIDQVGLFDPRYFLYYEEVDHCFAAKKAGWDVVFYPHTTVVHIGGESAKSVGAITKGGRQLEAMQVESELLYFRKNHGKAAALLNFLLVLLADVINLAKRLVKRKRPFGVVDALQHIALVSTLFYRTRWGSRPTR
jgi:N-acetylglucosaminyl-diphospho-decaprenol L-rhamnosyltransferase